MAPLPVRPLMVILISIAVTTVHANLLPQYCPKGFANFGDSLTDTGGACDAFPFFTDAENPPYGETFFEKPAKRFCNGRVVPDFFSLAFRFPLLDAYFAVTSFNYAYGINFAEAGATAAVNPTAINPFSVYPFQLGQFIRFMNSSASTRSQPACNNFVQDLPKNLLSTWLYTIEAGGNDILPPLIDGIPIAVVNTTFVANGVQAIVNVTEALYATGARQFLIFGLPAGGCATNILTLLGNLPKDDTLGCIAPVNSVVQNFNSQLLAAIKFLNATLPGVHIAYFDYYGANIDILTNPAKYGFIPALKFTACCGAPGVGDLNYNPAITCGHPPLSNNCANPEVYTNWDGVHFTEHFYRIISEWALNGTHTIGGFNYVKNCLLEWNLEQTFGPEVTYTEVYGEICNNLFT